MLITREGFPGYASTRIILGYCFLFNEDSNLAEVVMETPPPKDFCAIVDPHKNEIVGYYRPTEGCLRFFRNAQLEQGQQYLLCLVIPNLSYQEYQRIISLEDARFLRGCGIKPD